MSDECSTDDALCCEVPAGPLAVLASELPQGAAAVRTAGFAVLREGRPATVPELAEITGIEAGVVRKALLALAKRGAAEVDEHGDVVGIGGLSLIPSPHELVLAGVELHTWCALDAVGIPAALGIDAVARSRCGWCKTPVEVTVDAGIPAGSPQVTIWYPQAALTNMRQDLCAAANLFCNREHLDDWHHAAGTPPGEALSIAEVVERGRQIWAAEAR